MDRSATIIVVSNEKGGSGKTTTAMHIIIALMEMGFQVGTLDLDIRQRSLSRYLRNRDRMAQTSGIALKMPDNPFFGPSGDDNGSLETAIRTLSSTADFVVIDCPGSETSLVRQAHTNADVVVTPINDSFVDLDVIAELSGQGIFEGAGVYGEMLQEQRRKRLAGWQLAQDWLIVRNRLSHIGNSNKSKLADKLEEISGVMGFTVATGLSERVIFRQLFLAGLTILDLDEPAFGLTRSRSNQQARTEVYNLVRTVCTAANRAALASIDLMSSDGPAGGRPEAAR